MSRNNIFYFFYVDTRYSQFYVFLCYQSPLPSNYRNKKSYHSPVSLIIETGATIFLIIETGAISLFTNRNRSHQSLYLQKQEPPVSLLIETGATSLFNYRNKSHQFFNYRNRSYQSLYLQKQEPPVSLLIETGATSLFTYRNRIKGLYT